MVVNTIIVILVCNREIISVYDKFLWNTKIILIMSGLSFGAIFLGLRFIEGLSIKKLFLIFLVIRVLFLYIIVTFQYLSVVQIYYYVPPHVLNGDIFTPYTDILQDIWRSLPPVFLWWYTYSYLIYGLNDVIWRVVNLLLEVGIVYVMIQIFTENSNTEKGWNEENYR